MPFSHAYLLYVHVYFVKIIPTVFITKILTMTEMCMSINKSYFSTVELTREVNKLPCKTGTY